MLPPTIYIHLIMTTIALAMDVPEFLHVCHRRDPKLNDCVKESIEHLRAYLRTGVPEYNIPSMEPLLLKELVAAEGSGVKISGNDINIHGASDFTVTGVRIDIENMIMEVDVDMPKLYIDGIYRIEGRVMLLPISGSGPMVANFTGCSVSVRVQGELIKDEAGLDHLHGAAFNLGVTLVDGSLRLDNLFGEEHALGDLVNNAINRNFQAFVKELRSPVEKVLAQAFGELSNNIINPYTFEQLSPTN